MNRLGLVGLLALAGLVSACGESHTGDDGGDIDFDAGAVDAGPAELCGNGALDPGEMCDDGNTTAGDGCDPSCAREPFCGDGTTDGDEVCDDRNNRSADGCRSDCRSDETCGNGLTDFAVGEICDGEATCGADCRSVTGCGDGTQSGAETCDDSNTDPWDGCDAACHTEIAMVVDSLSLADTAVGCDINSDGRVDNAFASALGLLAFAIGPLIEMAVVNGDTRLLLVMRGLDDPAAANDDDFRIVWAVGADGDMDPSNDFGGSGTFLVAQDALNPDGSPRASMQASVMSNALMGGPEDLPLPLGIFPIELRQGHMEGTTVADLGELFRIQDGLLCGGIPASLLALVGGLLGDMLVTDPPCDGGAPAELLDVIIAGGSAEIMAGDRVFPVTFTATPPDLDLDTDGLEGFEIATGSACQPVVSSCTDGDGMVVDGRGCFADPRIADGYSSAFEFTAVRALLGGVTGPMM